MAEAVVLLATGSFGWTACAAGVGKPVSAAPVTAAWVDVFSGALVVLLSDLAPCPVMGTT
jgi:hypothetical protein